MKIPQSNNRLVRWIPKIILFTFLSYLMFLAILVISSVKRRWNSEGMDAEMSPIAYKIILNEQIPVFSSITFPK